MATTSTLSVTSKEFGRGKGTVKKFKSLDDAKQYVKDYLESPDYIDADDRFHTDYSTFELSGFTLKDIGTFSFNAEYSCREYQFN